MHFYRRNLPHIETFNATYFVTFRVWKYPYLSPPARSIALRHCLFENGKRIELHACVIMPTHVHLLFTALEDEHGCPFSLARILKSIKGVSARNINKLLGRRGQLWQDESFDRIMRAGEFQNKLEYIITNPISAGLVEKPGQYRWLWLPEATQARVPVPQKSSTVASTPK
ncbi:MAG TPA: transposase [Candidatus Angelobacter sp.]|nr:transposase [Candidatus Angelobacter sp.]